MNQNKVLKMYFKSEFNWSMWKYVQYYCFLEKLPWNTIAYIV
jgi:hypothetical protein